MEYPNKISIMPAKIIGDPKTYTTAIGVLVEASGFEFDDAVALRIVTDVDFYYAFADNDLDGDAKSNNDATRAWRPAGATLLAFYAEDRKVYIRAKWGWCWYYECRTSGCLCSSH